MTLSGPVKAGLGSPLKKGENKKRKK